MYITIGPGGSGCSLLMSEASSALAKSGTITLELALLGCPTTVVYGLTSFNRFVAKYILRLKLPFYCIVNILANKKVFPELIETGFSAQNMAEELLKIETSPEVSKQIKEGCQEVAALLGPSTPSATAAGRILELCAIN